MSNTNNNPVSQEAVSFINNINFADPDSLKNSMLTLVSSMIDLRNKNAELVTTLKEKQALPQPQQGPAHPPGQTKPCKGEKFSGETNLEVDEFLRQVKLQCDMDRTPVNMKKLVLLSETSLSRSSLRRRPTTSLHLSETQRFFEKPILGYQ
jgi:hypothetical protein